ncbi:hypothetical protein G7013_18480 [Pseudomonas viridiflava]|uniref:hypothetical protein n=1 Tax=Pseudomonas viridiflava TaxID=33069 RepID=UPI000EFB14EC|nr:hypothetical protein [Pseudomonas viridiflava]MBA1231635.1 hypothetical protein [Pseudomonas viridiflava]
MNVLNRFSACVLIATLAGFGVDRLASASSDVDPARSIELRENQDEGGNSCTIAIETSSITVNLNEEEYNCENDEMRYFRLNNVRSATEIILESRDCDDSGGWVLGMKTYIDPVTTGLISIEGLKGRPMHEIVAPGVWMIRPYDGDENTPGKLSCLRINISK